MNESFDFGKFINNPFESISEIETFEEMEELLFKITNGFHFPFNPPEPIRSKIKNKLEELKNKGETMPVDNHLLMAYNIVSKEYVPTPALPPGAMY